MDKLIFFLKIIAWFAAVISTVAFVGCIFMAINYPGSIDEIRDKLNGVRRTYPAVFWFVIAVISWAFIIAF